MKTAVEYIMNCIRKETKIEQLRQDLAADPHFSVYTSFTRFDRVSDNEITPQEFVDFLFLNNCYSPDLNNNLRLVIDFFDTSKDGSINFEE